MEGFQCGDGGEVLGWGNVQVIRSIIDRYKIGRERLRIV